MNQFQCSEGNGLCALLPYRTCKRVQASSRTKILHAESRATAEAHFWHDHAEVLAGRDLVNSGTWLGLTLTGRFALLTNFREARLTLRTALCHTASDCWLVLCSEADAWRARMTLLALLQLTSPQLRAREWL